MELLKKNIHMDRIRTEGVTQIALEDDVNLSENKPDVSSISLERGELVIEEVKPGTDCVNVRGRLNFCVLYYTQEPGCSLVNMEGRILFDEKINLQGVMPADTVRVDTEVEDLSIGIINSRKLSVQSVVTLYASVEELYDEEAPIGLYGDEKVEYRKVPLELAQITICKNDIYRIREEFTLPSNYPNVFQILWNCISLCDVEFRVLNEKLSVQGEARLFMLYEGEGEDHPIRSYETALPFSGVLECHGCREGDVGDIRYLVNSHELSVRPDLDGEERNIGLELAMDLSIHVYADEKMELVTDLYGVTKEIETQSHSVGLRRLLSKVTGKCKVTDRIRTENGAPPVLQLVHSEGKVLQEGQEVSGDGIQLTGWLQVKVMYITGDDENPYSATQAQIPYQYHLEVPGIKSEDMKKITAQVEQLQVTMLDGEEMDVKAVLSFETTVFQAIPVELISQVTVSEPDSAKMSELPGMVIHVVKAGDNLWNIGKRYYVPVDLLRDLNDLKTDELQPGQKLLIVKQG